MGSLYVLGGRQRKLLLKNEEEWNLYEAALVLRLDTDSGRAETCVEYKSPNDAKASSNSSVLFKSGALSEGLLYTCTSTEVLVFEMPKFRRVGYFSLPCFNDLHHVTPLSDGTLAVANTGLDMVLKVTRQGDMISEWNVLGDPPWSRFDKETDYRKVESTKPHKAHPNFLFELDRQLWVTRFHQRDAICLENPQRKIDIAVEKPHDGVLDRQHLYFTTVNGKLVIVEPRNRKVEKIVDLYKIDGQNALLGWCRGLLPVDEKHVWVGFTRIRKTQFRENILWAKNLLRPGITEKPTHIALYDIVERKCLREIDLERHGMNIVFSVFPAD